MATDLSQALSSKQGRVFKDQALKTIQDMEWRITRTKFAPVENFPEVDFEAIDPYDRRWWFHARGSWRGSRPGLIRSDTTRKLLSVIYDLSPVARNLGVLQGVVTSHMPEEGAAGSWMIKRAIERGVIAAIYMVELEDL